MYFKHTRLVTRDRRFVVTERGYMGITPASTQVGDLGGIVFGCRMPCILRRTSVEQSYRILGATFLLGKQTIKK
jgi:hypothetical protein